MSEDKKVKRSGTAVSAFLPDHYVQKMDELIAEGKFNSRSDFMRDAVRSKIDMMESQIVRRTASGRVVKNPKGDD